jgi:hypothetical protein
MRLVRMVLRVGVDLDAQVDVIAECLFQETRYDYPRAAVVRGLIVLGLLTVARSTMLAPLFVGVRIARGRKKGSRRSS